VVRRIDRGWPAILTGLALLASAMPASAQTGETVTACDTLLAARRLDAAGPAAAPESACRRIARAEIGPVEQRALIGGAPYECLVIRGAGRCLWVVP
jgi:hypothetical protein